ncbi:MAG: hypothetical protein OXI26_06180 [bacterium]|nr:hypothetical protein [bacterium]
MTPVEAIRAKSAEAFGFSGDLVEVGLRDGPVLLAVHVDESEHCRRAAAQLGAITDRELLTALWELPAGLEISASALPGWTVDRLQNVRGVVVAGSDDSLVRAARPPLRISGALAIGQRFDSVLRRVGQVSALAPMAVIVRRVVDAADPGLLDAQLFGVGVGTALDGVITPLVEAAPVVPTPGPYLWLIAELAYEQLVGELSGRVPTP